MAAIKKFSNDVAYRPADATLFFSSCLEVITKFPSTFICHILKVTYKTPLWWVCTCRSKCVSGTGNSLTSSGLCLRVSSVTFISRKVQFQSDTFPLRAEIPTCSSRSEFAVTLATYRPDNPLIDLTANSNLGVMMLYAVKLAIWILYSIVPVTLPISLVILSVRFFPKVWTSSVFRLIDAILSILLRVISRSTWQSLTSTFCQSLLTALPTKTPGSKSPNWLRSVPFCSLFLQAETIFVLPSELFSIYSQSIQSAPNNETKATKLFCESIQRTFNFNNIFKQLISGNIMKVLRLTSGQSWVAFFWLTFRFVHQSRFLVCWLHICDCNHNFILHRKSNKVNIPHFRILDDVLVL